MIKAEEFLGERWWGRGGDTQWYARRTRTEAWSLTRWWRERASKSPLTAPEPTWSSPAHHSASPTSTTLGPLTSSYSTTSAAKTPICQSPSLFPLTLYGLTNWAFLFKSISSGTGATEFSRCWSGTLEWRRHHNGGRITLLMARSTSFLLSKRRSSTWLFKVSLLSFTWSWNPRTVVIVICCVFLEIEKNSGMRFWGKCVAKIEISFPDCYGIFGSWKIWQKNKNSLYFSGFVWIEESLIEIIYLWENK